MDPVTHTMVGAVLADAGARKYTPLAAVTLVLAANAPDIDIVAHFAGPYTGLAWRRGLTHGIPALVVLPFLVLGVMIVLDRLLRWRRPGRPPIRRGPTLALAVLGTLTHPSLDWLNTYGMRWLMPIDGRWFYGDSLFIIDPWLWLGLGGALFVLHSRRTSSMIAWSVLAAAMTYLIVVQPIVPAGGKLVWLAGLAAFAVARLRRSRREVGRPVLPRIVLAGASLYIASMIALDFAAQREVRGALAAAGIEGAGEVMVGPAPGNPFAGSVIAATPSAYHLGTFHWFRSPRTELDRTIVLPLPGRAVAAAVRTEDVRNFLVWSRFPFYEVRATGDGYSVRVGDARYGEVVGAGGLAGVTVQLDRDFRPR